MAKKIKLVTVGNINAIFRDRQSAVNFGLTIDPWLNDQPVSRSIHQMVRGFTKILDRRLSPKFLAMLIELVFSADTSDAERRASSNVFNLVVDRAGQNLTSAKNFFGQLIESYLTLPETQARFLQPFYVNLICLIHGVGQRQQSPHPALMALYEAGYLKDDGQAGT